MTSHQRNILIMGLMVLGMVVYDIFLEISDQTTLSNSMVMIGWKHPFFVFYSIMIPIHGWTPHANPKKELFFKVTLPLIISFLILDALNTFVLRPYWPIHPFIPMLCAVPAGLCWQQKRRW